MASLRVSSSRLAQSQDWQRDSFCARTPDIEVIVTVTNTLSFQNKCNPMCRFQFLLLLFIYAFVLKVFPLDG